MPGAYTSGAKSLNGTGHMKKSLTGFPKGASVRFAESWGWGGKIELTNQNTGAKVLVTPKQLHSLVAQSRSNPSVRTAPKSAIPAKFVTAKVRRVGNKVQILLNK